MSEAGRLNIPVPGQLERWLKAEAFKREMSLSGLVRSILLRYQVEQKEGSIYAKCKRGPGC
jgi:hypothetical protein